MHQPGHRCLCLAWADNSHRPFKANYWKRMGIIYKRYLRAVALVIGTLHCATTWSLGNGEVMRQTQRDTINECKHCGIRSTRRLSSGGAKCVYGSWIDETGNCRICPAGMYCDPNNMYQSPRPCPKGTFSKQLNITEKESCTKCPARTFGDRKGLDSKSKCKACEFGSTSQPGRYVNCFLTLSGTRF